jgi:O-antigen/teichoic acid export membrane protein
MFIAMAVAARVYTQEQLGIWALVNVLILFGAMLADGGISTFVVREKVLRKDLYSSAFYLCLTLSVAVGAILVLLASPIATLLGYPSDFKYFAVAGLFSIPLGLMSVLQAKLRRDRRFVTIMLAEVAANFAFLISAIYLLSISAGLWAMIIPAFLSAVLNTFFCALFAGIPRFDPNREDSRQVIRYTWGLVGFSFVNFIGRNIDHVLIGRWLGAASLGVYSLAYRIMMLPLTQINSIALTVALPYLAPHQDDPWMMRHLMRKLIVTIGVLTTAPMIFVFLQRDLLVHLLFGPGWQSVAQLLSVFVPLGLFQTFVSPIGLTFQVSGQTRLYFFVGTFHTAINVLSFVVGIWIGNLHAVVIAYTIATLVASPFGVYLGMRTFGSGLWDWATWCLPFLLCLPICWLAHFWIVADYPTAVGIALDGFIVVTVCGIAGYWTTKKAWGEQREGSISH